MLTIKQYQRNLKYLNYYKGAVDGKAGSGTRSALKAFQADFADYLRFNGRQLTVDGVYGANTDKTLVFVIQNIQAMLRCSHDGLAGLTTTYYTRKFQKAHGLNVDGVCGKATLNKLMEVYRVHDERFKCQCGGKYCSGQPFGVEVNLVELYGLQCSVFGEELTISSGFRCPEHNKAVGGVSGSRHMLGRAADVYGDKVSSTRILANAKQNSDVRYAYINSGRAVHEDTK